MLLSAAFNTLKNLYATENNVDYIALDTALSYNGRSQLASPKDCPYHKGHCR
jgi:hypothetical protein